MKESNNLKTKPIITVFTPSFNRAHTLSRTYNSLKEQTDKRFIWMIIDDGSTDNTSSLVKKWIDSENGFAIEYYYKENGGMHTAHNLAYDNIVTELNVCIDSDDHMPKSAIADILSFWNDNKSDNVAGIIALDADINGDVVGSQLPKHIKKASTHDVYAKYKVTGDKKFIYRTDVITSVPRYPEYPGEKIVPLGYKYEMIADNYPMLLFNKVVCIVDYQINGSSNTIYKQYIQSPRGFSVDKIVRMTRTDNHLERIKCIIHYIAECRIARDDGWLRNSPLKFQTVLLYPFGVILEQYIYFINNKKL